ncbi:MAG: hypothetical protein PHE84_09440 [bacterium]|nr:hypothetical protein [bacterium]
MAISDHLSRIFSHQLSFFGGRVKRGNDKATSKQRSLKIKAMENMQKLGFVREFSGKRRTRLYLYEPYLKILSEGTEPNDLKEAGNAPEKTT